MKKGLYIVFLILGILLIGLVSAGLWKDIQNIITGKAIDQPTNVSVTISGTNPVNVTVDNSTLAGGVTPVASTITTSEFYVTVCDPDGVGDINDSSVEAEFGKSGQSTRTNSSCVLIGDLDSYCANYTCTIDTWYWDGVGTWTINASATDLGNLTRVYNNTFVFNMNELKAIIISPAQLQWTGLSPGGTDIDADNEPTLVNNTGNYDGTIDITGLDLYGETITSERFAVGNFSADETTGACGAGTFLVNSSAETIVGTDSNPGNLSAGASAGQEQIYYCIDVVPLLSSQEYTTDTSGSWTVTF